MNKENQPNSHRIGIITEYSGSINYGGLLQAYALCKKINSHGFACEQLDYNKSAAKDKKAFSKIIHNHVTPKNAIKSFLKSVDKNFCNLLMRNRINKTKHFRENMISHSDKQYNRYNIAEANDYYDIFITGSDQVWYPGIYNIGYMLGFAKKNKRKIAYAASIGVDQLNEEFQNKFKTDLQDYHAISVREKNAVNIIQPLTECRVEWALDPTLLLSRDEWDDVCSPRLIKDKYIFCYFLSYRSSVRKLVKEYAARNKLKIVTIPFTNRHFRLWEFLFFGKNIYDADPGDFVSLLKYAEFVFTDSFHASVFSLLYNKPFCVSSRAHNQMGSRIYSLLDLFEQNERFLDCDDRLNISYVTSVLNKDTNYNRDIYELMKKKSEEFLINSIE